MVATAENMERAQQLSYLCLAKTFPLAGKKRWGYADDEYAVGLVSSSNKILSADKMEFISITYIGKLSDIKGDIADIVKEYGLKFHVSLPEDNPEHYAQGWDIVCAIGTENKLSFKVIRPGLNVSDSPLQRGKDITIYAEINLEKNLADWKNIIQTITETLARAEISPGYQPVSSDEKTEYLVTGSHYISYRFEKKEPPAVIREQIKQALTIDDIAQQPNKAWPSSSPAVDL